MKTSTSLPITLTGLEMERGECLTPVSLCSYYVYRNIEDILAEKGEIVKKLVGDDIEITGEDFIGKDKLAEIVSNISSDSRKS